MCAARISALRSPHMVAETRRTRACAARTSAQRTPHIVAETRLHMRVPPTDARSALRK